MRRLLSLPFIAARHGLAQIPRILHDSAAVRLVVGLYIGEIGLFVAGIVISHTISPSAGLAMGVVAELLMMLTTISWPLQTLVDPLRGVGVGPILGGTVVTLIVFGAAAWLTGNQTLTAVAIQHKHIDALTYSLANGFVDWSPGATVGLIAFLAIRFHRLSARDVDKVNAAAIVAAVAAQLPALVTTTSLAVAASSNDALEELHGMWNQLDQAQQASRTDWSEIAELADQIRGLELQQVTISSSAVGEAA